MQRRIMPLFNSKPFDLDDIDGSVKLLTPQVIAHHLARICRFNGGVPGHYSVAQHSILVAHLVEEDAKPYALIHDATEVVLSDISREVKRHMVGNEYARVERLLMCHLGDMYLGEKYRDEWNRIISTVTRMDRLLGTFECHEFFVADTMRHLQTWPAEVAEGAYLDMWKQVMPKERP